ncbi:putative proton-coupled oligopeptide transporter of the plasma membrane [Erysiphe necator]|uniref:Putative proton-coupled oligopeptide transporter of the plasma membrane n=1 Tax=Uncinula necator TaxID=52586 RepID=A0A0B1P194_UNCNE|nr:putative proton-coupled oligopeptide transporter of the plasma membrane [Erysiphe necator]
MASVETKSSLKDESYEDQNSNYSSTISHTALNGLHTDDDPTLNPWTFRMFLIGLGLSAFGSTLATIFLFRPQFVTVSVIFLAVISYFAGNAMSRFLPSKGLIGRWLNPHSFNSKEHIAIVIMSHTASTAAYATEVLAAQKLYYDTIPNSLVAILLLISSQLLGYGMAGILRSGLVYPTKMSWPQILPLSSLIETLHRDKIEMKKKAVFFWIIFVLIATWEIFPQYIMPVLTGISVFCLANRKSLVFTKVFGGANGNEGLGLLSLCFDWQYITIAPFFLPLITLFNSFIGNIIGFGLQIGLYYGNIWNAKSFPFLGQQLYARSSNTTHYLVYNQSEILDNKNQLNVTALTVKGTPYFAATHASYLLTTNLSIGAMALHILLWNFDDLRQTFRGLHLPKMKSFKLNSFFKQKREEPRTEAELAKLDPHYRQMLVYAEVPSFWYLGILIGSFSIALFSIYSLKSTLPWWGLVVSCIIGFLNTVIISILAGSIGFGLPTTSVIQMIGGQLFPGKPVANMYFVLFGANTQAQALNLISSLKFGQYGKLSPRCTLTVQTIGTVFGAIINFFVMSTITTNRRDILLSTQGTNVWSGHAVQSFNSNAIAFGALSKYLFGAGRRYQFVIFALPLGCLIPLPFYFLHKRYPKLGLNYLVTPVICWFLGDLTGGINSSTFMFYSIGFFVQLYIRPRYPKWFMKYNYVLAAAISGGTEFMVFLSTFALQGASGREVIFPKFWGNNFQQGNYDYCAKDPALR